MTLPKADRQLERHANEVLAPGERLVAAARALAVGPFEGRLGILGEVLSGVLMQSLLTGESVRRAHRARFPAAARMVIGLTDRRVLVWRSAALSHRPVRFLGDVPIERLASVSVRPAVDPRRLTFSFVDASPVSVTAYKRDDPERFAENFHRRLAPDSVPSDQPSLPVTEETATPLPVAALFDALPPPPELVAAAPATSAPPVPASAARAGSPSLAPPAPPLVPGGAVGLSLPPPPPAAPTRPRPPARSWATAMQHPESRPTVAAWVDAPPGDQKKCIQCGTLNPGAALFCTRCFYPFGEPAEVRRPPAAQPPPVAVPMAVVADRAVSSSLSWGSAPQRIKTKHQGGLVWQLAIAAFVGILLAAGARAGLDRYSRTHVLVPASIAGLARIDDPSLQQSVQQLENLATRHDMTGKAAFYGYAGDPRFYFAAFEYRLVSNESPDDIFSGFAEGFAKSGVASMDLKTKTTETSTEATFICAKVKGSVRGSICMWSDSDVIGFVRTFRQGIQPTHDLTAVVRTSVES